MSKIRIPLKIVQSFKDTNMLEIKGLEKHYRIAGTKRTILHKLDMHLDKGEIVAVSGKSGCGKTTLLNIIAGLTVPSGGVISFRGRRLRYVSDFFVSRFRNRHLGFIFQTFKLLDNHTVKANILLAARIRGRVDKGLQARLIDLLARLEMSEYINTRVGLLSGGQKQRVAIARALINDPDIILADEPTANLDRDTSIEIFKVLEALRKEGKAILIVTHKDYMLKKADRVFHMEDGVLKAGKK